MRQWFKWLVGVATAVVLLLLRRKAEAGELRSSRWDKTKDDWLKKYPTCAACGTAEDLTVHHKYPFSWPDGEKLELDESNFITLCEKPSVNDHLNVGHLGDWQSRNPNVEEDAAWWLAKRRSRPYPIKDEAVPMFKGSRTMPEADE